jgi:hypothetical protein
MNKGNTKAPVWKFGKPRAVGKMNLGRDAMKRVAAIVLLGFAVLAVEGSAQVNVQVQPEMQILALMFKEKVASSEGLPMVRVQVGKVLLRDGGFVRELPVRMNEMNKLPELLQKQFRLYCGPNHFGIFKYAPVPGERKPKKNGDYLEVIPVDQDATVQAIINKTRLDADIQNLLNMSVEEATSAAQNETTLKDTLAKAKAAESTLLQSGKVGKAPLFFVPIQAQR